MMNLPRVLVQAGSVVLAAVIFSGPLRAGDDAAIVRPVAVSPSAQMDEYLQGQKIMHSVESTGGDFKGDGAEVLTVKIYGVAAGARQDTICTALAADAKKGRVHSTTVLFYTLTAAADGQQPGFQPSRLPSGNGEVDFAHEATPASYHLQRSVKL